MTTNIAVAAALVATGLAAAPASASCIPASQSEREALADAVFIGRVLSVDSDRAKARFRVLGVRKGAIAKGSAVKVLARPLRSSVTTNWSPAVGERWRVAVQRKNGRWLTNDCLGTRRTAAA